MKPVAALSRDEEVMISFALGESTRRRAGRCLDPPTLTLVYDPVIRAVDDSPGGLAGGVVWFALACFTQLS